MFNFITNIQSCSDFVNDIAPLALVYYSHFSTIIVALIIGILVFKNGQPPLAGRVLFSLSVFFSLWVVFDLITWISYNSTHYMFFWSFFGILTSLIYISCIYFAYVFINKKNISLPTALSFFILLLPTVLLTPTTYNLSGFNIYDCISVEQFYFTNYFHALGIVAFVWILALTIFKLRKITDVSFKKQIILMTIGLEAFIATFFTATFLDSYLVNLGVTGDYMIGNYGLFGIMIFMGFLAYLIVRFKSFNIKLLGAQALIYALVILIGSQFFFIRSTTNMILTGVTLLLAAIFGGFLIRGVKREIKQREEIEVLAKNLTRANDSLETANVRLKELDKQKTEFVSIASHQLRSPLTAIKGYSSMLLEGSFGPVEGKAREAVDRVFQSSQKLVTIIEDFLNITRIELGTMKYEMADIDLAKIAETVVGDMRPNIEEKGLRLDFGADGGSHLIRGDSGKLTQVVSNIIDNAVKYTPTGSISVAVKEVKGTDGKKHVRVEVKDTGVGIEASTLPKLFEKFIRADDAGKTNITGTGLGLYVAKQIMEGHQGKIWAESAGKGKGSTFIVEV